MSTPWVTGLIACVLLFWALGAYNRLVRLRAQVGSSLQVLVSCWQEQAQIVDARLAPYASGYEPSSQWSPIGEDAMRWRTLALSAQQFLTCMKVLQGKPNQLSAWDDLAAVRAARDIYENSWRRVLNAQDDLAGASVPPDLQMLWAQHEPLAEERLRDYNQAVKSYSLAINQFPAVVLAWVFSFGGTSELS